MRNYSRKVIPVFLALLLVFSVPFSSYEGTAEAASGNKPVRLVMLQKRAQDNGSVTSAFRSVGVKVTSVTTLKQADPKKYDGLILPGGSNDIVPSLYGAKNYGKSIYPDIKFDRRQIKAMKRFVKAGKPVLGICRGMQVINVAFGGSMKQDLCPRHCGFRRMRNVKGSLERRVLGKYCMAYHSHHQGVKRLGKGLVVTSYDSRSKEVEGFKHETLPVYGMQWHPELRRSVQGTKGLFRTFKKECLKCRKAKNPLSIRGKTVKVSYNKVKKKAQKLPVKKVISFKHKGKGKMRYARVSGSKRLIINKKTGKVTVKKRTKKGTYRIKVMVKAAGNANYKPSSAKTVTIKIKVR